ncbi:3'(2'),5'-bisphosphate nucleotidase CysQ [Deferribacteres bacterium DY0037]
MNYDEGLLYEVINIALQAGKEIMHIYQMDFSVQYKSDNSPLTDADMHSNDIIIGGLKKLNKQYPILSEETKPAVYADRRNWKNFWLVDPIDGTKEFVKKNGEFTVNIALIQDRLPVIGVVYAPALDTLYYGMKGFGAFRKAGGGLEKLPAEKNDPLTSKTIKVAVSRSHLNKDTSDLISTISKHYPDCRIETISKGSSLKLCMVAEGSADIYPRIAPTMEWDTAAAQGVVEAAGKGTYKLDSFTVDEDIFHKKIIAERLVYNKDDLLNPFFVVI